MSTTSKEVKPHKPLPPPNSDFYQLAETLPQEELATLRQVRSFMESKVAPIINKYWVEDSFPFELLPAFKDLNLGGLGIQGYGCRGGSALLTGLVAMEMASTIPELKLDVTKAIRVLIAKLNPNKSQYNEDTELINDQQDKQ